MRPLDRGSALHGLPVDPALGDDGAHPRPPRGPGGGDDLPLPRPGHRPAVRAEVREAHDRVRGLHAPEDGLPHHQRGGAAGPLPALRPRQSLRRRRVRRGRLLLRPRQPLLGRLERPPAAVRDPRRVLARLAHPRGRRLPPGRGGGPAALRAGRVGRRGRRQDPGGDGHGQLPRHRRRRGDPRVHGLHPGEGELLPRALDHEAHLQPGRALGAGGILRRPGEGRGLRLHRGHGHVPRHQPGAGAIRARPHRGLRAAGGTAPGGGPRQGIRGDRPRRLRRRAGRREAGGGRRGPARAGSPPRQGGPHLGEGPGTGRRRRAGPAAGERGRGAGPGPGRRP